MLKKLWDPRVTWALLIGFLLGACLPAFAEAPYRGKLKPNHKKVISVCEKLLGSKTAIKRTYHTTSGDITIRRFASGYKVKVSSAPANETLVYDLGKHCFLVEVKTGSVVTPHRLDDEEGFYQQRNLEQLADAQPQLRVIRVPVHGK